MKPRNISAGLGAIRRAQASGSTGFAGAPIAVLGGRQVRTTVVPSPGDEITSAVPPASCMRLPTLFRRPVLMRSPTRAGSKPTPSSEMVTSDAAPDPSSRDR